MVQWCGGPTVCTRVAFAGVRHLLRACALGRGLPWWISWEEVQARVACFEYQSRV